MIQKIRVTNYLEETIELELAFPEKSGFVVQNIDGLGPVKANINTTELATTDGAIYNSARATSRNIVFELKFLFKPTIEDVRQLSYKYFPLKKPVRISVITDNRMVDTIGYVESNEPTIFSDQEGCQISIICPDAYFYSAATAVVVFSGVNALFEFPFSNESLTEDLIEFGEYLTNTNKIIHYVGDAETGMIITIHVLNPATNITIYDETTRQIMRIDTTKIAQITGSGLIRGDDIIISTVKGSKYISLLRSGKFWNIINCLDKNSDWFYLVRGDNSFTYTAETGEANLEFKIEYKILYEGI